jgi:hypothetical protein
MRFAASQKILLKASPGPRLPWPLPSCPARVHVCESALAAYSIVVGVEAWDNADPRAVLSLRCARHIKGRAFPDTLLLQRIPLTGLNREQATEIFAQLAAWLCGRAQFDACVGAA